MDTLVDVDTPVQPIASTDWIDWGRYVLEKQLNSLSALPSQLGHSFAAACDLLLSTRDRIIVTGIGKSGHIGRKIAATLASTGTPSFFVHPGEAFHGDLGMITRNDAILALSYSGETDEVIRLVPALKSRECPILSLTGREDSTLAQLSDVHLSIAMDSEACFLGLAPTTSTTATLLMGDALAMALQRARGFTPEDFAYSHPGGSLGKQLLLRVRDVMHTGDAIPIVPKDMPVADALMEMTHKRLGCSAVVDDEQLLGIFTDGDLRRTLHRRVDLSTTPIHAVMTESPITVSPDQKAADVLNLMRKHAISQLLVIDDQEHLIGAFNMVDLMRAGLV